jgi:hypothetical protein
MEVNKYAKYTTGVGNEIPIDAVTEVKTGEKPETKTRLSSKLFSITMLGTMAIIIGDGLRNPSNDPIWALTCGLMGIPIALFGLFELWKMINK